MDKQFLKFIKNKYKIDTKNGCWIFLGAKCPRGYGRMTYKQRASTAHRFMLIAKTGKEHHKLSACHICDNPPCINPEHLWWGTQKQNGIDCVIKNRRKTKLKMEDIIYIKAQLKIGAKHYVLAKKFNVSRSSVTNINRGKLWAHVKI